MLHMLVLILADVSVLLMTQVHAEHAPCSGLAPTDPKCVCGIAIREDTDIIGLKLCKGIVEWIPEGSVTGGVAEFDGQRYMVRL